jgi:hypothetical protein
VISNGSIVQFWSVLSRKQSEPPGYRIDGLR